jgi:S-sulfo-L-cysteine synthase (O-acetyl-L-serine-dependent)
MDIKNITQYIGNTPLVAAAHLDSGSNTVLLKLEGNNPAGSVKDRPAYWMINEAEKRKEIKPGDTLLEATSGNTGIALAFFAAVKGYKMKLVMPETASLERRQIMKAYGAELVLTPENTGMEGAIDKVREISKQTGARILDQFNNPDNPLAHYMTTGPELWSQSEGKITHLVSSMGTTGTITGCAEYLKKKNPDIKIIGVQPEEGAAIPGIRKWEKEYMPSVYREELVDKILLASREDAIEMSKRLALKEGIFCGISAGGAAAAAFRICRKTANAVIAVIIPDRGDRYLSTGIF